MRTARFGLLSLMSLALAATLARPTAAQSLSGLAWRNVGPFRAGRVSAVSGAIGAPGVFYAGFPAGGLWKTTNAGTTWGPVFDAITTTSAVGAVAVAPSDTSVLYVGTGDFPTGGNINEGDGVYKSVDAGRTWRPLGLASSKQIPSILVDPRNSDLVVVAAQGDFHAAGGERGVYRSADGGRSWARTLYVDSATGIERLAMAFDMPSVMFAATDRHYTSPGPPAARGGFGGGNGPTGTALYRSSDEGLTWTEITGGGLPRLVGRMSVAVAMGTHAQRVYIEGTFGLYRSDDGGVTWRQMAADDRRIAAGQGGYDCGVYVSPSNPDMVYTVNTASYVSTDGGATFTGLKGAPGGDDPQQMWIDPTDGRRMLMGLDQGATVTLDGGRTWSLWYNQSTEQVYHISVDSSFPYWIYASQQDAGAIRTRSRGNYGAITPLDWSPVGAWEWGTVVADPRDPNVVYGSGSGILKITWPSEQIVDVSPAADPAQHIRTSQSQPLLWAPWNPRELIAGFQDVRTTVDGGRHWTRISPDLGWPKGVTPLADSVLNGPLQPGVPRPGTIEALAASTVRRGVLWAGTTNGLIKLTRDEGRTWTDVSVPNLPDSTQSDIVMVEASHHDPAEAYAVVDGHRAGDYQPLLYRTRDYGATWSKIVTGLPVGQANGSYAQVLRADTKRAGLLFAGTASAMYVSFDDGDHWESLQLNMPTTVMRDALIVGNDLVIGTYGRGIWILDDISPLRQITPETWTAGVHLFTPGGAVRVHRNVNQDTPFPPEVPHADNPPDGAAIHYFLKDRPAGEIALDVVDAAGRTVRHLSSVAPAPVPEAARPPEPDFWIGRPYALPANAGINRALWNLRYDDPPSFSHSFEINANPGATPASPEGPLAQPGTYTVRLSVGGATYSAAVTVRNDPRSPATAAAVAAQSALQSGIAAAMRTTWDGFAQAEAVRAASRSDTALRARITAVAGDTASRGGARFGRRGGPQPAPTFVSLNGALGRALNAQDNADQQPTEAMLAGWQQLCGDVGGAVRRWNAVRESLGSAAPGQPLAVPACGGAPARRHTTGARGGAGGQRGNVAAADRPAASRDTDGAAGDCDADDPDCGK